MKEDEISKSKKLLIQGATGLAAALAGAIIAKASEALIDLFMHSMSKIGDSKPKPKKKATTKPRTK